MTKRALLIWLVVVIVVGTGACVAQSPANVATFTISATDVAMPLSGNGSIPLTLTSVNGFVGTLTVGCMPPTPAIGVNEPNCADNGVFPSYPLTANGTAQGVMRLNPDAPLPAPAVGLLHLPGRREGAGWAVAGVLMLGVGLRSRRRLRGIGRSARGAAGLLTVAGMLIGLGGLGVAGCGGAETLTPGVYTYTVTASTYGLPVVPVQVASTTVKVTVPPGVVVQKNVPLPP